MNAHGEGRGPDLTGGGPGSDGGVVTAVTGLGLWWGRCTVTGGARGGGSVTGAEGAAGGGGGGAGAAGPAVTAAPRPPPPGLSTEKAAAFTRRLRADPQFLLAQNVATCNDPLEVCLQRQVVQDTVQVFQHAVPAEGKPVTNQKNSGKGPPVGSGGCASRRLPPPGRGRCGAERAPGAVALPSGSGAQGVPAASSRANGSLQAGGCCPLHSVGCGSIRRDLHLQ